MASDDSVMSSKTLSQPLEVAAASYPLTSAHGPSDCPVPAEADSCTDGPDEEAPPAPSSNRRWPLGAEIQPDSSTHFRVWAPRCQKVTVLLLDDEGKVSRQHTLEREDDQAHFSLRVEDVPAGTQYWFQLDDKERYYPDPTSRFQPIGPHGPSEVVDPDQFAWTDEDWRGIESSDLVFYEMHLGTFTSEGTWRAAAEHLAPLAELGITVLEVMPIADFPGRFGWGYDGVQWFAPTRLYGTPDDVRHFVNTAHQLGMAVILDVVYNHLGPDGNFMAEYADTFFSKRHSTDWGSSINFDDEGSEVPRQMVCANAAFWIRDYHFDGLRLDATQDIHDDSPQHIIRDIQEAARRAAQPRRCLIVAENEPQDCGLLRPTTEQGMGLDAAWNDDFHHSAMVVLTRRSEAYYSDYRGNPQEFVSAAKHGYLYQGQWYSWQKQRRGRSSRGIARSAFVNFIQNHDQIANSSNGKRCHQIADAGTNRAMTALLLLMPGSPMIFQGQEFGANSPFYYFADHNSAVAEMVREGRSQFLRQFPSLADEEVQSVLPDPGDPANFVRCKLDQNERQTNEACVHLHRDLLHLRRDDATLRKGLAGSLDGAVIGPEALVLRYFGDEWDDRILLVNFGRDLHMECAPEPLLAPPDHRGWTLLWSSEHPRYGGGGTPNLETSDNWRIPGAAAFLLAPATQEAP